MTVERSQDEIVERVEGLDEVLGFESSILIAYLNYENAEPYLKDEADKEDWDKKENNPLKEMQDYMSFAWEKANNQRGLSANRSVAHIRAWLWLAGEEELLQEFRSTRYEPYGKPKLTLIDEWIAKNKELTKQ